MMKLVTIFVLLLATTQTANATPPSASYQPPPPLPHNTPTCKAGENCDAMCLSKALTYQFCCGEDGPGFWGKDDSGDSISCETRAEWGRQAREKIRLETEQMTKSLCTITESREGCHKLTCKDGTSGEICDGKDGDVGPAGPRGQNGTSCSVEKVGHCAEIKCTDGTAAKVCDGKDAPLTYGPYVGGGVRLLDDDTFGFVEIGLNMLYAEMFTFDFSWDLAIAAMNVEEQRWMTSIADTIPLGVRLFNNALEVGWGFQLWLSAPEIMTYPHEGGYAIYVYAKLRPLDLPGVPEIPYFEGTIVLKIGGGQVFRLNPETVRYDDQGDIFMFTLGIEAGIRTKEDNKSPKLVDD